MTDDMVQNICMFTSKGLPTHMIVICGNDLGLTTYRGIVVVLPSSMIVARDLPKSSPWVSPGGLPVRMVAMGSPTKTGALL